MELTDDIYVFCLDGVEWNGRDQMFCAAVVHHSILIIKKFLSNFIISFIIFIERGVPFTLDEFASIEQNRLFANGCDGLMIKYHRLLSARLFFCDCDVLFSLSFFFLERIITRF